MNYIERYGWDKYKEEGLAELTRIRDSNFLRGKEKFKDLLNRYIELYKNDADIKKQVTGKNLYPELSKGYYKSSCDKAYSTIKKMRELLDEFYKNEEGKQSQYRIFFVSKERDYRIGIEKNKIDEYTTTEKIQSVKPHSSLVNSIKINTNVISEKILNFISNFYFITIEALFNSKKLALRVMPKENFGNNIYKITIEGIKLIIYFLIFWYFIVLFTKHLLKILELQLLSKYQILFYSKYFEIKYKQLELLLSSFEIFPVIVRFFILAILIPFGVYSAYSAIIKTKKFSFNFLLPVAAFQFYFLWRWILVFAFLFWLAIESGLLNMNIVLSIGTMIAFIWYLIMHFKGLCTLYNLTWKKGILPFILNLIISFFLLSFI